MNIQVEQHGPHIVLKFHSETNESTTPPEEAAVHDVTAVIAKHLADSGGRATIVQRDPVREPEPRRWQHKAGETRCSCEFPRLWQVYPDECHNCMKLLP